MSKSKLKRLIGGGATGLTLALGAVLVAPSSPAMAGNGVCGSGEWCIWVNDDGTGYGYDNALSDLDYRGDYYPTSGGTVAVDNSSKSVRNRGTTYSIHFYTGYNTAGSVWSYPNNGPLYGLNSTFYLNGSGHIFYN